MPRRPNTSPSRSNWVRAAFAPFAWLGIALLFASGLALVLQVVLGAGPDAGAWNPAWSFAEVQLPGVDAPRARALVEEAGPRLPDFRLEWREGEQGSWIVLVGPADRQELLSVLRDTVGELGHAPTRVGFGRNLARITTLALHDPGTVAAAARAMLPLALFGGGLVFLLLGGVLRRRLRRRLRRDSPPAPRPKRSTTWRILSGVALGLSLALCAEGVSAAWAALVGPVVEQAWVSQVFQRGGNELYAVLPMIVLVAPLAEEVFFRGYLLEALDRAWGRVGSLLLSSAAFAAVHGHGPAAPIYFLYGVGLGLAARRSGTLVVPIAAHITVNALGAARLLWE